MDNKEGAMANKIHHVSGFFWAHNEVFDRAARKIGPYAFLIYSALCYYGRSDRRAFPSHETLAKKTGISPTQIRRALAILEKAKLIRVEHKRIIRGKTVVVDRHCQEGKALCCDYYLDPPEEWTEYVGQHDGPFLADDEQKSTPPNRRGGPTPPIGRDSAPPNRRGHPACQAGSSYTKKQIEEEAHTKKVVCDDKNQKAAQNLIRDIAQAFPEATPEAELVIAVNKLIPTPGRPTPNALEQARSLIGQRDIVEIMPVVAGAVRSAKHSFSQRGQQLASFGGCVPFLAAAIQALDAKKTKAVMQKQTIAPQTRLCLQTIPEEVFRIVEEKFVPPLSVFTNKWPADAKFKRTDILIKAAECILDSRGLLGYDSLPIQAEYLSIMPPQAVFLNLIFAIGDDDN